MLTYHTGAVGSPTAAKAMGAYLSAQSLPAELSTAGAYYDEGRTRIDLKPDLDPELAKLLKIDPNAELTDAQIAGLLGGLTAEGEAIPGKHYASPGTWKDQHSGVEHERSPIAYVDLTFSAPKSFSVAWALAKTDAERETLWTSHWKAVMSTVDHIEKQVGEVRRGKTQELREEGSSAWLAFHHYTSRPTIALPFTENGLPATELHALGKHGDMQVHTHVTMFNALLTKNGHVGSFNLSRMRGGIKEWGAVYQAFLATDLREKGVDVGLDRHTGMGYLKAVPHRIVQEFSRRTVNATKAARAEATKLGLDWDALTPGEQRAVIHGTTKVQREPKSNDAGGAIAAWELRAKANGYNHESVLTQKKSLLAEGDGHIAKAREASLPLLSAEFFQNSVVDHSTPRVAAAKGLIAEGIREAGDVSKVTETYRSQGVKHDGQDVRLIWERTEAGRLGITTSLHVDQEEEFIDVSKEAHADRSVALKPGEIEKAIAASGLDFSTDHGKQQLEVIRRFSTGGRWETAIGVAGAGKTALLTPLVTAWKADGREVYGTGLANRFAYRLQETGIDVRNTMSLHAFANDVKKGTIKPDSKSVLVIDEISAVGTRQILDVARLQKQHGFQVVALGDDQQTKAIEAGEVVNLLRRSFGSSEIPEILTSVRQESERQRETALMFREGRTLEALQRMREDGTLVVVPGDHDHAVKAVADLWEERRSASGQRAAGSEQRAPAEKGLRSFSMAISTPTNFDARRIALEIRRRKQARGEVSTNEQTIQAVDQKGERYGLTLAPGDNVRLFNKVWIKLDTGRNGLIGWNGRVLQVTEIRREGIAVKANTGRSGFIPFDKIRDPINGRVMLTYGDVISLDARTGDTAMEHITAAVSGSRQMDGYMGYTANSRHRSRNWMVVSDGEERKEILDRRPFGDTRDITFDNVVNNVARNLAYKPKRMNATELLESAQARRQKLAEAKERDAATDDNAAPPSLATRRLELSESTPTPKAPAIDISAEVEKLLRSSADRAQERAEERVVDTFGMLVVNGSMTFKEAYDSVAGSHLSRTGDIDHVAEERLTTKLVEAIERHSAKPNDLRDLARQARTSEPTSRHPDITLQQQQRSSHQHS